MSGSDSDFDLPVLKKSYEKKTPVAPLGAAVVKRGRGRPRKYPIEGAPSTSKAPAKAPKTKKKKKEELFKTASDSDSDSAFASDIESDPEEKDEGKDTSLVPSNLFSLPSADEQPKVWVLSGACASGKTYMLKYIQWLYGKRKHFKFGVVYTATGFTGDYSWTPERSIMKYDEEHLKTYITGLRNRVEEGVAKHGKGWKLPHNYLIFDDNNGTLRASEFFINFISTHRHTSTTVFMLSQLLTARGAVNTTVRSNTSFALMWPTASQSTLKGLWENYGGMMTYEEFKQELNNCRHEKYRCLVLKNAPDNYTVDKQFTTLKAGEFPDFTLKF
jgi:hypothetical protein